MTTYAFPSISPSATRIEYVANTLRFVSPITGAVKTEDRGGERWVIQLQYLNLYGAKLAEMSAFVVKLNGQQHRFTLQNHAENNRGAFGGTPLVAGAGQTGDALDIDGCSVSVTNWIRAGDWFGVDDQLLMCTDDASSGGGGDITVNFRPRIVTAPPDNDPITTAAATGIFMLAPGGVSWSNVPGGFSDLSLTAYQDITA